MISLFWSLLIFMTCIAMAIVIWPLCRTYKKPFIKQQDVNIDIYRGQFQELQQQYQNAELSELDFLQAKKNSAKTLLETMHKDKKLFNNLPAFITAGILFILMPIVAFLLYSRWGSSQQLEHYWLSQTQSKLVVAELRKIRNPQQVIDQLQERLKEQPESDQGWFLLGRLYFGLQQYSAAYEALLHAYQLNSRNIQYQIGLCEAQFFKDHNHLNAQSVSLLKQIIKSTPTNISAVNLLAINAYLEKKYQLAVNYWETIVDLFPVNSEDSRNLMAMIARAQKKIGSTNSEPRALE